MLRVLASLAASLAASLLIVLVHNFIRTRRKLAEFRRRLPASIKLLDHDLGLFGNHMDALRGPRSAQLLARRHQQLGPTLGFMIQELGCVSTTDLDLIKRVVFERACANINRISMPLPMHEIEVDCIFTCENEQWRKIRRAFAPALKPARFMTANVLREIQASVGKLVAAVEQQLAAPPAAGRAELELDADELIRRYSLQLVLSCLYKQYDLVNFDLKQKCQWVEMVDHGLSEMRDNFFFRLGLLVPSLRQLVDWLGWHLHPIGRWRQLVLTFIKRQSQLGLEARKQLAALKQQQQQQQPDAPSGLDQDNFELSDGSRFRRNMVDHVVDQFHAGKLTAREFFHSSFLLFGAADKTASDSLVASLYELGLHARRQLKLRRSVREHGLESRYLTWFINESLRLHPPVGIGCTRTLSERVELGQGAALEPGMCLFTPTLAIHHSKLHWGDDALEFRPERWARAHLFHPAQFIPFGAGVRACPGKEFALFQMKLLLATIVDRYELQCEPKPDVFEFDSPLFIFNLHNSPTRIKITKLHDQAAPTDFLSQLTQ